MGDIKAIEKAVAALPADKLAEFRLWSPSSMVQRGTARSNAMRAAGSWTAWPQRRWLTSEAVFVANLETHRVEAVWGVLRSTPSRSSGARGAQLRIAAERCFASLTPGQDRRQRQAAQRSCRPLLPRSRHPGEWRSSLVLNRHPCAIRQARRLILGGQLSIKVAC